MKTSSSSVGALLLVILASPLLAQVVTGTPAFGTFGGGPFDVVNLGSLNVHFTIPVFHRAGRGIPFEYNFGYDSSIWAPVTSSGQKVWQPMGGWGWTSQTDAATGWVQAPTKQPATCTWYDGLGHAHQQNYNIYYYNGFIDPLGTPHHARLITISGSGQCNEDQSTDTEIADDGSGWTVTVPAGPIVSRSGQVFYSPIGGRLGTASITDTNGNKITTSNGTTFYDTLSSTVPVLTISGSAPTVTYTYTNYNGNPASVTMNYTSTNIKTNFGCSGISEYTATGVYLVSSIKLPDNSQYVFTYEQTVGSSGYSTGRLSQVTLPSGGTIKYDYGNTPTNNTIQCTDGSAVTLNRTLTPGSSTAWAYARSFSGNTWTTVVTDPTSSQNQTVYNFSQSSTGYFYQTQREVYQGTQASGTLLENDVTCYNGVFTICENASVATIARIDMFRQLVSSTTKTSLSETVFGAYGLPSSRSEFDFGMTVDQAPPTGWNPLLLSYTTYTYGSLGNHINDHRSQVTVKDGRTGNIKSQLTYYYDQGTPTGTPVCPAPNCTPQHGSVTGARGNLTTLTALTSGTSTLSKTFTYYDTGNVHTATDFNGGVTTFSYGACGNSFLTETDFPVNSLKAYQGWDANCNGGVMISSTDRNNNVTYYDYTDANFWRISKIRYPDGGSTAFTYTEGTNSPWNVKVTSAKDLSTNVTTESILDGFGRTVTQGLTTDPVSADIVDTTYDVVGRVASVSNPYRTITDPTYGLTQYSYDQLNRIVSVTNPDSTSAQYTYTLGATQVTDEGYNTGGTKQLSKVYQTDGLGRVVSVCEVSSTAQQGSGTYKNPAACGQDIAATGFLTSYQYDVLGNIVSVSQPGVNARTFAYDGVSRLTQEVNPEAGTTNYTYDATGQQGDLASRSRPKQNQTAAATTVTTYTFDKLHRPTGVSYNDSSTPSLTLAYDQTTVGTYSPTYPLGRLTNATVAGNAAGTIFGYDTMGRVAQEWQCTPLNCGNSTFSLGYSYDWLGNISQFVNGKESTSGVTYTYTYDAASRLTKITSSLSDSNHPATLLTIDSTTTGYNALGELTKATLGNNIVRTIGYDKRARPNSLQDGTNGAIYNFSLGYANDSNILTGSDSVNGNWTYTYDDLGRLSTGSKTGEAVNWAYDAAGNRWKQNVTVGTGLQPSYTFDGNNHIQSAGSGCAATTSYCYDSAGNLLNDSFYEYQYDAEGRVIKVLTTSGSLIATYTYDAFSNRVRTAASQTTDFIFDQSGHVLDQLSGTTWQRGEIFAGGIHLGTYNNVVNPATTYFEHSDWVGAVRARSNVSGASVETCTNLPFGDSQSCTNTDVSPYHFAGTTLDAESNLQHAIFRQYTTTQGNWTVPDPAGLAAVDTSSPQSWNRYSYASNNPISFNDPLGLLKCAVSPDGGILPGQFCSTFGDVWFGIPGDSWYGHGAMGLIFQMQGGFDSCSDFMPCGLVPTDMWQVGQSVWSDVLGLPSGLNCPQVGGLSNVICGGVSPAMDQAPVGEGSLNAVCKTGCSVKALNCRIQSRVLSAYQAGLNYAQAPGFWGALLSGFSGPGYTYPNIVPIIVTTPTGDIGAGDVGAALQDFCGRSQISCLQTCQEPNAPGPVLIEPLSN